MSEEGADELQLLIRSGWNLIALESCEEDRALNLLERIAQATKRSFLPWTLASGFSPPSQTAKESGQAPRMSSVATSNSFNEGLVEISARDEPAGEIRMIFQVVPGGEEFLGHAGDTDKVQDIRFGDCPAECLKLVSFVPVLVVETVSK